MKNIKKKISALILACIAVFSFVVTPMIASSADLSGSDSSSVHGIIGDVTGPVNITGDLEVTGKISSYNSQFRYMRAAQMISYAGETAGVSNCVVYFINSNFGAGNTETNLCNSSLSGLWDASYGSSSTNVGFNTFAEVLLANLDDKFTVTDDDSLSMEAADWSISIWIKKDNLAAMVWDVISKGNAFPYEWRLKITNNAAPYWLGVDEESDFPSVAGTNNSIIIGQYHWIVITYDSSLGSGATYATGLTIFVDGVDVTSTRSNDVDFSDVHNLALGLTVNYTADGAGGAGSWTDFYYVKGKAWSQAEIDQMWLLQRGNACQ